MSLTQAKPNMIPGSLEPAGVPRLEKLQNTTHLNYIIILPRCCKKTNFQKEKDRFARTRGS